MSENPRIPGNPSDGISSRTDEGRVQHTNPTPVNVYNTAANAPTPSSGNSHLKNLIIGSIGYTAVGTLLSAMAVQTRTRDVLLPILLFPIAVPVLLASVKASNGLLAGAEFAEVLTPLNILIVYDIVFIAVAFMVFDFVVEE